MLKIPAKKREKAFRLRLERRSLRDISKEVGVSAKTITRWEKGWVDAQGRSHPGWQADLEKAWREKTDADLEFGLMIREERLRTYEKLARMAVNKIIECFPSLKAKTAADAKMLLSETRELLKLIAKEKGEWSANPQTVVAVKTDISFGELRERYMEAQAVEVAGVPARRAEENAEEDAGELAEEEENTEGDGPDEGANEA